MSQDPVDQADLPPPGRLIADDDGSRVQCHLCGRFFPKLGTHVRRGHGVAPDEYREQFGLNRSTSLISSALHQKLSAIASSHLARCRPAVSVFRAMSPDERIRNASGLRRAERRLRLSAAKRQRDAARARPAKSEPLGNAQVRCLALARITELRNDPAWLEAWRRTQNAVTLRLSDEQLRDILALRGSGGHRRVAARYGVSPSSVRRIWSGEIGPR